MMNRRVFYQAQPGYYSSQVPFNQPFRFSHVLRQQYGFVHSQHQFQQPNFLSFESGWQNLQASPGLQQVDHRETIRQDILSQLNHKQPGTSTGHQNRK